MIKLFGSIEVIQGSADSNASIARVSKNQKRPMALRPHEATIFREDDHDSSYEEYKFILLAESQRHHLTTLQQRCSKQAIIVYPNELNYISDGDVVRINPTSKQIKVLYRRASPHNFFLLTERCNHYCLMCSQPPKKQDDSWIIQETLSIIPLISKDAKEIGFTGGEPTLLGDEFIKILQSVQYHLPNTAVHILTNGRRFSDNAFCKKYADIGHHDMMVGIPIYSDLSNRHDYIVQADGAFDETIRGIINLKRHNQKVEIRIVVHKQNYARLPQLAEFIYRNLTFVDQVVFMGLEITGFTKANLPELWIDPIEYKEKLAVAVQYLNDAKVKVGIYNHQLCLIDKRIWPFAKKSISDWKNEYHSECSTCDMRNQCGGFFASSHIIKSAHIKAIQNLESVL